MSFVFSPGDLDNADNWIQDRQHTLNGLSVSGNYLVTLWLTLNFVFDAQGPLTYFWWLQAPISDSHMRRIINKAKHNFTLRQNICNLGPTIEKFNDPLSRGKTNIQKVCYGTNFFFCRRTKKVQGSCYVDGILEFYEPFPLTMLCLALLAAVNIIKTALLCWMSKAKPIDAKLSNQDENVYSLFILHFIKSFKSIFHVDYIQGVPGK